MEIFIFPELIYALVLANIMSPKIWRWRNDSWFSKNDILTPLKKIHRLKQYIMDHFSFNLDLDTWGLTTKKNELSRFNTFINESILSESNALFGYEGDKYYFDIDIRKHFGLDKYTSDIIPYWKTETIEAMEAFKYKEGYPTGAGECVSLATLYAAAAFIVSEIPLDDIYLLATPLHSQNFLAIKEGILTNNRRIVTKAMWFNGTELSAKARRALENEKVTVVAHNSGYIHTLYSPATINQDKYRRLNNHLQTFLTTPVTFEVLASFLRQNKKLQSCFQLAHSCCGKPRYIEAEKVYTYEHSSKARIGGNTQTDLLHEIEEDEFYTHPIENRLMLSEIETFFRGQALPADEEKTIEKLKGFLKNNCCNVDTVIHDLLQFCRTIPRLPAPEKTWQQNNASIDLAGVTSSEEAIARLEEIRITNPVVNLAFAAFRDLSRSPWKPFLKAALERNPVAIKRTENLSIDEIYHQLASFSPLSIYDGETRLSQPDEVWNFKCGDGLELAICFINILRNRFPQMNIVLDGEEDGGKILVKGDSMEYIFQTTKKVPLPDKNDFSFAAS
jgi:hypothetical protein